MDKNKKQLLIIDGYSLIFRIYYASSFAGKIMQTSNGFPTNAIHGYINVVRKLIAKFNPDYLFVALDSGKETFRKEKFETYKATRNKAPEELVVQFDKIKEAMKLMNVHYFESAGYEADDIVGTLVKKLSSDFNIEIVTSDRDYLQLINDSTTINLVKKGFTDLAAYDTTKFIDEYSFDPIHIIDHKALMGDTADNIKGVAGIGEKTSLTLIQKYKTVENLYDNIDEITGKAKEKLIEGKQSCFDSKELATIHLDVPIEIILEDYHVEEPDWPKFNEFCQKYELKSLMKQDNYTDKFDESEFKTDIDINSKGKEYILYLESTEFSDPKVDTLIGIGFKEIGTDNHYFSKRIDDSIIEFISNNKFYTFNFKYVSSYFIINKFDLNIHNFIFDLKIAQYAIDNNIEINSVSRLENLSSKNIPVNLDDKLFYNKKTFAELSQKNISNYVFHKLNYIENYIFEIKEKIIDKIKEVYELDFKCSYILSKIENNGIIFDVDSSEELRKEFSKKLSEAESNIFDLAGEKFNVGSPKQLGVILFEKLGLDVIKKTKTGYSTDADVLNELLNSHPIVKFILEHRKISKILSAYLESLPSYVKDDKRIHPVYDITKTATGRLSCSHPNLQTITARSQEGLLIRKCFISKEGYSLVSFDYSQIELRVVAAEANDKIFIEAFENKVDIHNQTAASLFGVPIDNVSSEQRNIAKTINFGILYGQTEFGLAKELQIPIHIASSYIKNYFEKHPWISEYISKTEEFCKETGYVETQFGRRRYIHDIHENNKLKYSFAKRQAVNMPIQGLAADIIKLAMINIDNKAYDADECKMLLQIHDELVFEIRDDVIDKYMTDIKTIMEECYELSSVNLEVSSHYSKFLDK